MALLRTLREGCDLVLVLANGSKTISRRGVASGLTGVAQQRVRRHSLSGPLAPSTEWVQSGKSLGLPEYQLLTGARCASSAQPQKVAPVADIRSSIQDHFDQAGVVKTKKFVVTAEELSAMLQSGPDGVKLIDVREAKEVEETGLLPRAINIPLTSLKAALQMDSEMFEIQYGLRKPVKDDPVPLVFYGRSAVKSSTALEIAYKLGLKKSRHYPGGWEEWSTRQQPGV